ncbi:MAG: hypothetical protein K0R92_1932 [Lachnospiraceae bacterium]|jgi:uncharacterized membrane protein YvbJ|nr:hypothetical protein [Lachnospiraceae bacterium]
MICNVCGRNTDNAHANFCEYCGSSFRQDTEQLQYEHTATLNADAAMIHTENINAGEKPISFWNWLVSMLLLYIPVVGIFIYPIMLFVWAFSSSTPKSKQNWARATLLVIVITIFLFVYIITSTYSQMLSNGFNINDYMQQYY